MHHKYAHLLPLTVKVWERFLAKFEKDYTLLEYDVRVGLGRDPGDGFEGNIRQMALDLSFRRIDCVAHRPTDITVIEITHSAGFTAVGQIAGYSTLYSLTYFPTLPVKSLLVCGEIQSDIKPILDTLKVEYIVV